MKNNKIFFFVEYSNNIGVGHYFRSRTISQELKKNNYIVKLVQLDKSNNIYLSNFNKNLPKKNIFYKNNNLNKKILSFLKINKVNLVFFDFFQQNNSLVRLLESNDIKTISFLSSPKQKTYSSIKISLSPYNNLFKISKNKDILGVDYIIFRKDFIKYSKLKKNYNSKTIKVSIIFGGSNNASYFLIIIKKIVKFNKDINFQLFFLSKNKSFIKVNEYLKRNRIYNLKLIVNSKNIAKELYLSDIMITSGGYSSFETSFLKKPFFTIQIAKNQKYNCLAFQKLGASVNFGDIKNNNKDILKMFNKTINNNKLLINMANNSKKIFKKWNKNNLIKRIINQIK